MAIRRLCEALVGEGGTFPLFGDGNQTRDITYVGDVVEATVLAGRALDPDPIYNVGGGHEVTLNHVIATLEELAGRRVEIERFRAADGRCPTHRGRQHRRPPVARLAPERPAGRRARKRAGMGAGRQRREGGVNVGGGERMNSNRAEPWN